MIEKEKAYEIADRYLIEYVGNLVGPGEPVFGMKVRVWIVPIFHKSKVATFPLAEIVLDSEGNIVYVPTTEQLEEIGNFLRKSNCNINDISRIIFLSSCENIYFLERF